MKDPEHKYASDPRSSEELVELHRQSLESDNNDLEAMAILHYRGGQKEFDLAKALTESDNPEDRYIGADILAQLGWDDRTFLEESVDILIELLDDTDPDVLNSAAVGLGHRDHERAIGPLLKHVGNQDPMVRFGVVFGLLGHEDERAVSALIQLSKDPDFETRNWVVFGLGSQIEMDTPEIREALVAAFEDSDSEIRGEALVGLARVKDPRTYGMLLRKWDGDEIGKLSVEAAGDLADPRLLPHLHEVSEMFDLGDDEGFGFWIDRAVKECQTAADESK